MKIGLGLGITGTGSAGEPPVITATSAPTMAALDDSQTPSDGFTAGSYQSSEGTISSAVVAYLVNGSPQAGTFDLTAGDVVSATETVTDSAANERVFSTGSVVVTETAGSNLTSGVALVHRWGQSNEGTLGNNPGQMDVAYRGVFADVTTLDNTNDVSGPSSTYSFVPYVVLDDTDDDAVVGSDTIVAPHGLDTIIGDGIPVGPTHGIATAYRDGGLFAGADEMRFHVASAAGQRISYFMASGTSKAYQSGDTNISNGWQYACYAARQMRTELINAGGTMYMQCMGMWQGEADTNPARANQDVADPYIVNYAATHLEIYERNVAVWGVEPPYFMIQLLPVWNTAEAQRDPYTDALNAERAALCRWHVDLSGNITDSGSGHDKMYYVIHDWDYKVVANSADPHVTSDEQRQLGEAIAQALRNLHGGDGSTDAYPVTEIKPQVAACEGSLNGTVLTVTGRYSDPGTVTVNCYRVSDDSLIGSGSEVITDTIAGTTPFSIDVALPGSTEFRWEASLEIASGEVSEVESDTLTTPAVVRSFDTTFNPSDFTYSDTNGTNDTATRLATAGGRYPRGTPPTLSGKIYFEVSLTGDALFYGLGTTSTPQAGGANGTDKCGVVGTNIQYTGGSVNMGSGILTDSSCYVAADLDAGLMWVRTSYVTDWNNDAGADPATSTGGLDISGMDLTDIVPLVGSAAAHSGSVYVLHLDSGTWTETAPAGFGEIG